ncbi:MAG: TIGR03067 domain-containing protein [Bacteroidia bacterium]
MKQLSILLFICLSVACSTSTQNNPVALNGTWVPVKQEMGGQELPSAAFEKQKLIISDYTYTVIAESVDKGTVKINGDKMDIYGKDGVNAGKHFTAIYKFENEQLTICYNLAGDSYPASFETKSKPTLFLSVFKKDALTN